MVAKVRFISYIRFWQEVTTVFIVDSSKDYLDRTVLVSFEGEMPTDDEVIAYVKENYGAELPARITSRTMPSEYCGLQNPGFVTVAQYEESE